jgi:microcystin-dependent protein
LFGTTYGSASILHFNLPDMVSQQNYMRVKQNVGLLPNAQVNGGTASRTLGDADMPDHSHTVTGTTSNEQHEHTFPIHSADLGVVVVDGNGGGDPTPPVNYTTPMGGDHTHTVTGTTNTYGEVVPNPVWDMNTAVTPRFTNFYLKMRVK